MGKAFLTRPAGRAPMAATFEALIERTYDFGRNGYLEVARKRLREGTDAADFLVVSRGFYESDGSKRWTKFVTLPDDPALRAWLAEQLAKI